MRKGGTWVRRTWWWLRRETAVAKGGVAHRGREKDGVRKGHWVLICILRILCHMRPHHRGSPLPIRTAKLSSVEMG